MKILVKKSTPPPVGDMDEGSPVGQAEESFEIPAATLTAIVTIITAVLTFSQAIAPKVLDAFFASPKDAAAITMTKEQFEYNVLQQAIKGKTPEDRANAIRLFVNAGLLKDPNGKLVEQAGKPGSIPDWEMLTCTAGPCPVVTPATKAVNANTNTTSANANTNAPPK